MGEVDRWANIHPDLLSEIAKRFYSYEDYVRLRLVCKKWNSKLPKVPTHKRNPWLVLPGAVDEKFDTGDLEEEKIYHLTVPEVNDDNIIRGSCFGWVIFVKISDGTLRMLNPFTKAHFGLPPISTFPDVEAIHGNEYSCRDLRRGDGSTYRMALTQLHKHEVWKVVTSSPPDNDNDDFMAVAVYGECCRLAFYKHNDSGWRDIPTPKTEPDFQDVVFFQDKIYAIDMDAQLYEFDTKTKPLPMGGISEAVASPPDILDQNFNASMNKYLIGCANGNLLMLVRNLDCVEEQCSHYQTYRFDIFKLNRDTKEWSRLHSLENYVLMIGYNSSIQMLPHTFPNGKGNHIYYTDNQVELHCKEIASSQDIGIFNLEDRRTRKLLLNAKFLCPPVWLLL